MLTNFQKTTSTFILAYQRLKNRLNYDCDYYNFLYHMTCLIPEIQQIQNFHADSLARIFLSIIHSFLVFLCQQAVLRQLFFINYKAICQLMIFNINSNLYLNIIYSLVVNTTTTTRLIYALRSAARHQLTVPRHRLSTYGRRAFAVAGPTMFNTLPDDLRDPAVSTSTFRQSLKTHLFSAYQHV